MSGNTRIGAAQVGAADATAGQQGLAGYAVRLERLQYQRDRIEGGQV